MKGRGIEARRDYFLMFRVCFKRNRDLLYSLLFGHRSKRVKIECSGETNHRTIPDACACNMAKPVSPVLK